MHLKVKADLGQLHRIREFVTEAAEALGAASASIDDLRIAVDEAVTNILTHGYGGPGDVEIDMVVEGKDLVVRLRDRAPSFDPRLAPPADLRPPGERDNPGGLGVYLMKSLMDEIVHDSIDGGNEIIMTKRGVVRGAGSSNGEDDG